MLSYHYNNIAEDADFAPLDAANNRDIDPMLPPGPFAYTPQQGSPVVDAGLPEPPAGSGPDFVDGWRLGGLDFDGGLIPRVFGERVDIGAVESNQTDLIFKNCLQINERSMRAGLCAFTWQRH